MTRARLPPIGFWSYARQDDQLSQRRRLNSLRMLLMAELQQLYGRDTIRLFQDVTTIPHGGAWEREIKKALNNTTFFIPIITPNFIQSGWCCREVLAFIEREKQLFSIYPGLPDQSYIFPIHYIDITDVDPADPKALEALKELQWFDFRPFRHRNYEDEPVQQALSDFAESICVILHTKVDQPSKAAESASREAPATAVTAQPEAEKAEAAARLGQAKRRQPGGAARLEAPREVAREIRDTPGEQSEEPPEAALLSAKENIASRRRAANATDAEGQVEDIEEAVPRRAVGAAEGFRHREMWGGARLKQYGLLAALLGAVIAGLILWIQPWRAPAADQHAWLYGVWKDEEDAGCSDSTRIARDGDSLRIEYGGETRRHHIVQADSDSVHTKSDETDEVRSYSRQGEKIRYVLDGVPFMLTRCRAQ